MAPALPYGGPRREPDLAPSLPETPVASVLRRIEGIVREQPLHA